MIISNQHQAYLSLVRRFNNMRGCLYVHTLIFQNDCLSIQPLWICKLESLFPSRDIYNISAKKRQHILTIHSCSTVKLWQWTELCSCHWYRLCYKILLVLSISKAPDPCDLYLNPFFMGSEEKWTISIDLKIIIRSLLHLKTLSIIESHPSAGNLQQPVGRFTLVHKAECILGFCLTSLEALEMGYTWGQ